MRNRKSTISIIFVGRIMNANGTPMQGATVEIINKSLSKSYGKKVTNDRGFYDIRYLEPIFGQAAVYGGDELAILVNAVERIAVLNDAERNPFILEDEDIKDPYIYYVDVKLTGA